VAVATSGDVGNSRKSLMALPNCCRMFSGKIVRWYLRYSLSLRDLEELLEERSLEADHTTSPAYAVASPDLAKSGSAGGHNDSNHRLM
jgi:hypothetical protein